MKKYYNNRSKKWIIYICVLVLFTCFTHFFSLRVSAEQIETWNGNGTEQNPYLIQNKKDFLELRDRVNDGENFENIYFRQCQDIDLNDEIWMPIGDKKENPFMGIYDGNGYRISNCYVDEEYGSLFGAIGGTVANLQISNSTFKGNISGSFAAEAVSDQAMIINCYSDNSVFVEGNIAGGIAGKFSEGTLAMCWSNALLNGNSIGGILGEGADVKLYSCYSDKNLCASAIVGGVTSYTVPSDYMQDVNNIRKINVKIGLAQVLFADHINIKLKGIYLHGEEILFGNISKITKFLQIINNYGLTIIFLLIIGICGYRLRKCTLKQIWKMHPETIKSGCIILLILAVFLNVTLIKKGFSVLNLGNGSFIFLINLSFIFLLYIIFKYSDWNKIRFSKSIIPLVILIGIVVIFEVLQFRHVPRYDATLYYGSMLRAIDLFDITLFSYIGAFVCWKWSHGLMLLLAPFEYLLKGKMIGLYLANIIITVVTLILLYLLLKSIFNDLSNAYAILMCACFIFMPYCLGIFTYLCMDWHLPFFVIWFLYGISKKNNLWISFCGYLLAFTKITGLFFYVFVLIVVALYDIIESDKGHFWTNLKSWWSWKKVICWITPAVLFCITFFTGDYLTIQNFMGSPYNPSALFDIINKQRVLNTIVQSFVFGFRWVMVLSFISAVIIFVFKYKGKRTVISKESKGMVLGLIISSLITFSFLCILNGDAECPRYTTIFNITYLIIFSWSILIIFKNIKKQIVSIGILTGLLIIQTFWTIDPSIILIADSIDTGTKKLYKLCMPGDTKEGMNLGESYSGIQVIGDLYTYNLEYSFYDDLLEKFLSSISPTQSDKFYVLDVIDYELHMTGSANKNYKIYWNEKLKKRTYNHDDSIYLDCSSIRTEDIELIGDNGLEVPDKFYLLVISRVDATKAIEQFAEKGYKVISEYYEKNIYGAINIYYFEK